MIITDPNKNNNISSLVYSMAQYMCAYVNIK